MKWLYSNWFDKVFMILGWLTLIWFIIGFVFIGGYIILLFLAEVL